MSGTGHEEPAARPLPWTSPGGKPCYVVGDGTGYVSRLADEMEGVQLCMAGELLAHADALLAERRATAGELRYLARRLCDSLRDLTRIAESRGARLGHGGDAGAEFFVEQGLAGE